VFLINTKRALEYVFIGFVISSMVLISVHLFFNDGLTASTLTTDELGDLDFVSSRDRNYLSFNFATTYPILLGLFLGFIKFDTVKFNKFFLLGMIGYSILGIIAMSSRTVIIVVGLVTLISIFIGLFRSNGNMVPFNPKNVIILIVFIGVVFFFASFQGYLNLLLYRFFEEGTLEDGSGRTDIVDRFFKSFNELSFFDKFLGKGYGAQYSLTGGQDTHNDYLAILSSYGFFGLFLWLMILLPLISFGKKLSFPTLAVLIYLVSSIGISPMMVFSTPLYIASAFSFKYFFLNKG